MKKFSNFSMHIYTEVVFGKDAQEQTAEKIKKYGGTKVLMVYDNVVKMIGLYDQIAAQLKDAGLEFVEFSGIQPNPRRSYTEQGVQLAREEKIDFVLGMGGGSTMDTAKAIASAMKYDGDWWDFYSGKADPKEVLPVGAISTISATGSEMSAASVILDDVNSHKKIGMHSGLIRPVFAILNPELTYSVPKFQTGAGTADILAHTFERYFYHDSCALGDGFAEGLLKTVIKYGPIAVNDPTNYEARAELMLCAPFSHNDITSIGHGKSKRGGAHGIESVLSATFDTAHGAGLAVIMPEWLRYAADYSEESCIRAAKFAIQVFGVTPDLEDLRSVAYAGADRLRDWLNSLGMPATLRELKAEITEDDIPALIANGRFGPDGLYTTYVSMTKEQMTEFYKRIL